MDKNFFLIAVCLLALSLIGLTLYFQTSLFSVSTNDQEDYIEPADESTVERLNFISNPESFIVPIAGVSAQDVQSYEAVKDQIENPTLEDFYDSIESAPESAGYNGYYWNSDEQEMANETWSNTKLIAELMIDDLYVLSADAAIDQRYRMPVHAQTDPPKFTLTADTYYPPMYLMKVMLRDQLLAGLYSDYQIPDRSAYIDAGLVAGLYYESDVQAAEEMVDMYLIVAETHPDYGAIKMLNTLESVVEGSGEVGTQLTNEDLADIEEYNAALEAVYRELRDENE